MTNSNKYYNYDVIIVGTGLAGLTTALNISSKKKILIFCKNGLIQNSSGWAQGGIAAVTSSKDSFSFHVDDTLAAGAGLCNVKNTNSIINSSSIAIEWLISQGVKFTMDPVNKKRFHLNIEGGHSKRRIMHSKDATGQEIQSKLLKKIKKSKNIEILEYHTAVDLYLSKNKDNKSRNIEGIYVFDQKNKNVKSYNSKHIVLASGGSGKVYLYTTNPDSNTGDGIAMASRVGAKIQNLEFVQFHPTCLYHPNAKNFLISEAIRGEGGILKLPNGTPFMSKYDPRCELASRDIVARAIDSEMKEKGLDFVYLDISHKDEKFVIKHFPNIYKNCKKLNLDITKEPIPVVPAAHYNCGGIKTDTMGNTNIKGLYAVGETAYTGLHGANRLASNSLLECLVVGKNLAENLSSKETNIQIQIPAWDESKISSSKEEIIISHSWDELRRIMWNYVGIVRSNKRLRKALRRVNLLRTEVLDYYKKYKINNDLLELRNIITTSLLIIKSSLGRKKSIGLHFNIDYPRNRKPKKNELQR